MATPSLPRLDRDPRILKQNVRKICNFILKSKAVSASLIYIDSQKMVEESD